MVSTSDPAQVGELYDNMNWLYDILMGSNRHIGYWGPDTDPGDAPEDRFTDYLISHLRPGAGARVLDVGCGAGGPAVRLAKKTGASVTGITVSGEEVRSATALAAAGGVGDLVRFEQVDAMKLPYADGSFDAVWAIEALMYLPDRAECLREIHRVLTPGGRLVFSDYTERLPLGPAQRETLAETFRLNELSQPGQYDGILAGIGFRDVRRHDLTEQLQRTSRENDRRLPEKMRRVAEEAGEKFSAHYRDHELRASALEHDYLGYVVVVAQSRRE
ncbi:methyltransferase domain-containing protein [Amycolatopsis sp. A133]|uniref:methyltransferase domain-containing protein n=1 Tax=Amycolatopsis sp. A133 TaxID=3064472 RepID=UPI0027EB774B|nr:methyltransferase domain-containing protein [Amycolatopsis sp. A133]MDQ7807538.1 methyltransferase domain-containing protein [Amycolatopsis sp. A133]